MFISIASSFDVSSITSMFDLYDFSFTPTTNIGASAEGADMTTFLAPACSNNQRACVHRTNQMIIVTFRYAEALSNVVKTPKDSTTYSAP
ncbi:hypothetical protein EUGRSUZ_C02648 [Eucalyptus grandis]|uniref:Uncharacterized protein n=2 Tax=Eucalyptus grandis TaxID=71139 RepID=A0A059CSV3_EUCGR|nr:hypothetical protein EUGRSUZ_C02648 [Eucalyptus grandis]